MFVSRSNLSYPPREEPERNPTPERHGVRRCCRECGRESRNSAAATSGKLPPRFPLIGGHRYYDQTAQSPPESNTIKVTLHDSLGYRIRPRCHICKLFGCQSEADSYGSTAEISRNCCKQYGYCFFVPNCSVSI